MESGHFYDLTREMRRLALTGALESRYPDKSEPITEALERGRRILFAPDDEQIYVETPTDRVLTDDRTGRAFGALRI